MKLEGNRKLIAGAYALTIAGVLAGFRPELFTGGEMSFGWTMVSLVGIIGGANVLEWFAKRPVTSS